MASIKYPEEVKQYIIEHHKGVGPSEMANIIQEKFGLPVTPGKMKSYYSNHDLNSGVTGYFKKGNVPPNKGKKITEYMSPESIKKMTKTQFKKGQRPRNTDPIGTAKALKDGYLWVKINDELKPKNKRVNWMPLHQMMYEFYYGQIPAGYHVFFKNKNNRDFSKENLGIISRQESAIMNHMGRVSDFSEITESNLILTRLEMKVRELDVDH